jgi:hypothetical protein
MLAQQPGNMRAWHHDPLIHMEAEFAEPSRPRQVGGGLAAADATLEQGEHAPRIVRADPPVKRVRRGIGGQVERVQREVCGFVAGSAGAVTENEARRAKAADPEAHEAAYGPAARRPRRSVEF